MLPLPQPPPSLADTLLNQSCPRSLLTTHCHQPCLASSFQRCGECEESISGPNKEGGRGGRGGREECEEDRLLLCQQRAYGQLVEEGESRERWREYFIKKRKKGLKP